MGILSLIFNEWTIIISALLYAFYKYSVSTYDFFIKRNVPFLKPIPFFGNTFPMMAQRVSFTDFVANSCEKFRGKKLFGIFEMRTPLLVINDPDLVKLVTVKDFEHFLNHRGVFNPEDEPLFGNSLFALKDQKWRDMRATLSPAFTGSKMRLMFGLLEEVSKTALEYLRKEAKTTDPLDIDMKDFFTRFTNDVIASAAFGIKVNSLEEKNNEFYAKGRRATNFDGVTSLKFFLLSNFRAVTKLFKIRLFDRSFSDYFHHLVIDTINYREKHGIVRPDMINLLLEARKGGLKHEAQEPKETEGFATVQESQIGLRSQKRNWTDDDIVANCFIFFLAGFDTASILMCFCAHELMENPEIQDRLREEVDEVQESLKGRPITYEAIQNMKYMDMVLSETLRKWPPAVAADRVCVKPYTLEDEDTGNKVALNVGDAIWIPINGLHHNPEFFPNPKKFDPERFSDENKHNIKPFTYLPFGVGPRNCIGSRFALMEAKVMLFQLLTKFKFEVAKKTRIPLQMAPGIQVKPKGGFWIRFVPRTDVKN